MKDLELITWWQGSLKRGVPVLGRGQVTLQLNFSAFIYIESEPAGKATCTSVLLETTLPLALDRGSVRYYRHVKLVLTIMSLKLRKLNLKIMVTILYHLVCSPMLFKNGA